MMHGHTASICRHTPEAGAVCGKAARTDLGGGRAMKRTSLPLLTRRVSIALLGGTAAWPLAALAQQAERMRRIGIIDYTPMWEPLREALREIGYVEGQNIAFEYRSAASKPGRLSTAAAELVRIPVDVIVTYGTPSTAAAKQATTTIPIVMVGTGDPVESQLVSSLARPGGNVTGNTILGPEVVAKRLQILQEAVPSLSRVALLWNPENVSNAHNLFQLQAAVRGTGLSLISAEVRSVNEFDSAFAAMMRGHPDGMVITADALHQLHIGRIINFLKESRLPGMFQVRENVVSGGFMSYGASLPDLFRRGASYVHKILQGTKPADLPVEQPTKFELVINLKTAKALGLEVPPTLLALADELSNDAAGIHCARACDAQHRGLRGAGAAAGEGSLTSQGILQPTGHEPADASFVRHRPLPTPHRGGLSSDVGDLAAGRAAEKLRSRGGAAQALSEGSKRITKYAPYRSGRLW
jgi:putative ABC transport system substrate-binding protein